MAGNIASDKVIGSLEFSTKYLGSKLIVVMGHNICGAIKAACDDFKDGHIDEIINMTKPAIRNEKKSRVIEPLKIQNMLRRFASLMLNIRLTKSLG